MSATAIIDQGLIDRVAALVREIEAVEQARPPVEAEVASETTRIDQLALKSQASGSLWVGPPVFSERAFNDSVAAALVTIAPKAAREMIVERVRRRCASWKGLRLDEGERAKRLSKLQADLRVARARLERQRREIEDRTGDTLPRTNDDPGVWLLVDAELAKVAATTNGRSP